MTFHLYLSASDRLKIELTKEDNVGVLVAYTEGTSKIKKVLDKNYNTFIDSGAFSVVNSGKSVNIDEYITFINQTSNVNCFAVLDEVPRPLTATNSKKCAENTMKNYYYMLERVNEDKKDKLLTTFHYGEPIEYLHKIIDGTKDYKPKYIAFGGRVGIQTDVLIDYFNSVFWKEVEKSSNPNIKIHAFGIAQFSILENYPWASADNTRWARNGFYGKIISRSLDKALVLLSDQQKGDPSHLFNISPKLRNKVLEEIEQYGFNLEELMTNGQKRCDWNVLLFKEWANNYEYKPINKSRKKKLW